MEDNNNRRTNNRNNTFNNNNNGNNDTKTSSGYSVCIYFYIYIIFFFTCSILFLYINMKLIYFEDGIKINYNQSETNIENIFGLDEENNIIQNFTFQTNITILDKNKFDENVNNSKKIFLENGF